MASKDKPLIHLVSGTVGGTLATFATHPLDMIKVRLQAQGTGSVSTLSALRSIQKTEGIHGFFQGVTASVYGSGFSWGLYFYMYELCKDRMALMMNKKKSHLGPGSHLTAASTAGAAIAVLTNPIWVIKTRMCLQSANQRQYTSIMHAFTKIIKEEGAATLYKGLVPSLWGVSHGAVQFVSYEWIKKHAFALHKEEVKNLSSLEYLVVGSLAKIVSSAVTYPYQVVRTKLQQGQGALQYRGPLDVLRQVIRTDGFFGLWRGVVVQTIRVTPHAALTFWAYESVNKVLRRKYPELFSTQ